MGLALPLPPPPARGDAPPERPCAVVVHRISGVPLALFLPLHFWALALAIEGEARLDYVSALDGAPAPQASETVLVVLLAVHLAGGLRVMALEFCAGGRTEGAVALVRAWASPVGFFYPDGW